MFLLQIKQRYFLTSILFGIGHFLALVNPALAQMRLGRGIQSGLEGHLLEYQIQQQPLEKMRSVGDCSIGIGVGCNKTASLLQKIVTEHSGQTKQDILVKAVGGENNYREFSHYYLSTVDLETIPFNSFWVKDGRYVLDSHQYSGLGDLERIPRSNLRDVVARFSYAPITSRKDNLTLKQGSIALKTAYGKTLIEEARQIPQIEQKIAASGLSKEEINFHLQQYLESIEAIENGDREELNRSLYKLLSNPYSSEPATLNRPLVGIDSNLDRTMGIGLEGDEYMISLVGGEASETAIFTSAEVTTIATTSDIVNSSNTPLYVAAGIGGVTLLAILLASSNGDSDLDTAIDTRGEIDDPTNYPDNTEEPEVPPTPPDGETPDDRVEDPILPEPPPNDDSLKIPEPKGVMQFGLLLALVLSILRKKSLD